MEPAPTQLESESVERRHGKKFLQNIQAMAQGMIGMDMLPQIILQLIKEPL